MARPLRIEYEGATYHVLSRGNEKKDIFTTNKDREKFLEYVENAHKKLGLIVHSYSLMNNHYHFLLETPLANLSRCMQLINSSYTAYFNTKKRRVGHLFQGRYKAILLQKESYLLELSRYIHLNPVKAKLTDQPENYPWSSYRYYCNKNCPKPSFLETSFVLDFFNGNVSKYRKFVEEGIKTDTPDVFKDLKAGCILGSQNFVDNVRNLHLQGDTSFRDLREFRNLSRKYITKEHILDILKDEPKKKKLYVYFLKKYTNYSLAEIVNIVEECNIPRISVSGVSKIVSRIDEKRKKNREFEKRIKEIERKVSNFRSDPKS